MGCEIATPNTIEIQPPCMIACLDETGDSRVQWHPDDPLQVAKARARFEELKSKGFMIYKVDARGGEGEVMEDFDPTAQRIIAHQQMVGG